MNNANLPKLAELHQQPDVAFANDQLNLLLNQPPHKSWIKKHPFHKNDYLPIDKVEFLLRRIFQQFKIEVLSTGTMFNSVTVHVRVHYLNPVTGEWLYHDGVGAKALQLNQGAAPSDMTQIKPEAVQMALPIAKSAAIKDAADHLGKLFGGDLNRKDTIEFGGAYSAPAAPAGNTIDPPHYQEPSKQANDDFQL